MVRVAGLLLASICASPAIAGVLGPPYANLSSSSTSRLSSSSSVSVSSASSLAGDRLGELILAGLSIHHGTSTNSSGVAESTTEKSHSTGSGSTSRTSESLSSIPEPSSSRVTILLSTHKVVTVSQPSASPKQGQSAAKSSATGSVRPRSGSGKKAPAITKASSRLNRRPHTTMIITSKPSVTVSEEFTTYDDNGSEVVVWSTVTRPACYAALPEMSYLSWVLLNSTSPPRFSFNVSMSSISDSEDTVTFMNDDDLPTAYDQHGTKYVTRTAILTDWNGVNNAKAHTSITTVLYPTQFWDYQPSYAWMGSLIGDPSSCAPGFFNQMKCTELETLWSHPRMDRATSQGVISDQDYGGRRYSPTMVMYKPSSTDLDWFLTAFPDVVALRQCQTTIFKKTGLINKPQVIQTPAESAKGVPERSAESVDKLTEADSPVENATAEPGASVDAIATQTAQPFVFTFHLNPRISHTASATLAGDGVPATVIDAPANTVDAKSVLQDALQSPQADRLGDEAAKRPAVITFASLTLQQTDGAIVVDDKTLTPDQTVTIGRGSQTTALQLGVNDAGDQVLKVGTMSMIIPAETASPSNVVAPITFGGITASMAPDAIHIGSNVISLGSTATLGSGAETTLVALQTNSAGKTEVVVGSSTATLQQPTTQQVVQLGGQTATLASDGVQIEGTSLRIGQSLTLGSGPSTTVIALQTNSDGNTKLIVGNANVVLPTPVPTRTLEIGGQTVTQSADAVLLEGKTLRPGQSATIGSGASTTVIAVETDGAGHTKLIVGSSTTTLSELRPIRTADLVITPIASNAAILDGKTLTVGGSATITGSSGLVKVTLTTDSQGRLAVIEPSTTVVLSTSARPRPAAETDLIVTALASDKAVINGKTLTVGGSATIMGESGPTKIILTTDASGRLAIVEPSTTFVLSTPIRASSTASIATRSTSRSSSLLTSSASPGPSATSTPPAPTGGGGRLGGSSPWALAVAAAFGVLAA